jgi:uncharacterized membrane protein
MIPKPCRGADRLRGKTITTESRAEIRHLHEKIDHLLRRQYNRLEIQQIQIELWKNQPPKNRASLFRIRKQ